MDSTIAHRTKRTISERMEDDPAFYAKFSKMLEDAISAFQQKRLADIEYLNQVQDIAEADKLPWLEFMLHVPMHAN